MIQLTAEIIESFTQALLSKSFDGACPTPAFHKEVWELFCSDATMCAIAAPRGHAKSTAITLAYILAMMLFRQRRFCLLISDTEGQAQMFLGDIKAQLESNEDLRALFGITSFPKGVETDVICELSDGYKFRIIAKGSEQKVRGLKWDDLRPDLIVGDDLENDEIVMNKDRREKFKRWFFGALLPCRSTESGIVRMVGTILHVDSLLNNLMAKPCRTYMQEGLKVWDSNPKQAWKSILYKAHNPDYSLILWPEKWTKEKLQAEQNRLIALGLSDLYSQEFLNQPIDGANAFFKEADFVGITPREKDDIAAGKMPLNFYLGVDLAISTKERADYSVFVVAGTNSLNQLFVVDVIRDRLDGREIVDQLIRLQQRYGLQFVAIEDEKISKAIGPFLREEMQARGVFLQLVPITPVADKKTRARSIQARMRIGSVRFDRDAHWFPAFVDELQKFDRGVNDDQVDAMALIGLALDKVTSARTQKELEDEEYEDERVKYVAFGGRSNTTGY